MRHEGQTQNFAASHQDGLPAFLKCPAEFWLEYHEPLLMGSEPITLEREHFRQQGYEVERYVKQLERFQTSDTTLVDFQRTFQTAELLARADVTVTDRATQAVDLFEIKAAASVKPEHLDDIAFQRHVSELAGTPVGRCYVITLNGDYIREGEIDVEQLFIIADVTDEVTRRQAKVVEQIDAAFAYLASLPVPSLSEYCIEHKLDCRFVKLHFPGLPDYTVFDISYLKHDRRRELLVDGVIEITEVPEDFPLSPKQKSQVDAAKSGQVTIDRDEIRRRICEWQYPLHFLDYETFQYAIPQFDGVRPFQQMCFQYSLHTIDQPGTEIRHSGYLSRGDDRPPRPVAEHLRDAMDGGIGTVFVWYEPFEKTRNTEMGEMFPDLKEFFDEVNDKTYDLMKIFADNLYVHPDFKGKTSIKKVLPVLVPELSYESLGIPDGMSATIKWYRAATWKTMDESERLKVFNDLEEYCELDTIAMVRIYEVLCAL